MKKTAEQYANDLIDKYKQVTILKLTGDTATFFIALQCAIIDVKHTIEALDKLSLWYEDKVSEQKNYYKQVLTILESKL